MRSPLPPPTVLQHEGFWVVRDDMILGGSKRRALPACFSEEHDEYVFCAPAAGFAQLALALACADMGKSATIITAKRGCRHPNTALAALYGAKIIELRPGYLSQVEAEGRRYCAERPRALLIPLGLADPRVEARMQETAELLRLSMAGPYFAPITDVWCAVGAGSLARALGAAFPGARIHAVSVGRVPRDEDLPEGCTLYQALQDFDAPAPMLPPWPSAAHYDAKIWQFASRVWPAERSSHLIWNVA